MNDGYKEHAKYLIASMGKDEAFEYAWREMEYHRDRGSDSLADYDVAYWADVAEYIDPVTFDQVSRETKAIHAALRREV